jgi:hypothetical protein
MEIIRTGPAHAPAGSTRHANHKIADARNFIRLPERTDRSSARVLCSTSGVCGILHKLEQQLQPELNLPRRIRGPNRSESRIGGSRIRNAVARVIQQVENLRTRL